VLDTLNPDQSKVVSIRNKPVLVLAGPGTGKTQTIVERIAVLIREEVDPDRILAITFTNKAAQEMKGRILTLTGKRPSWIRTIHGACAQLLRTHIHKLGISNAFQIASLEFSKKTIKDVIRSLKLSEATWDANKVARDISRIKSAGEATPSAGTINDETLRAIFLGYQEKMKDLATIDFDDLVYLALKLCAEDAEALAEIRDLWQHVIVDEFQDCDLSQYALVSMLGKDKGMVVVGDDDQSIYSFRSSTPEVLRMFERDFAPEIVILKTSYRLPRVIQEAACALIKNNLGRYEKELACAKEETGCLEVHGFGSEGEEADFTAGRIQILLSSGVPPEAIGVLGRRNADLARAEDALKRLKIPTRKTAERSFYEYREIRDMMAYITVLALPENTAALERVLKIEKGIPISVMNLLEDLSERNEISLYHALELAVVHQYVSGEPSVALKRFLERIDGLRRRMSELCISDLMRACAAVFAYVDHLKKVSRGEAGFIRSVERLKDLAQMADQFELQSGPGLINFINEMAIAAIQGGVSKDKKSIRLSTLHSAKGLEFKVVFLMGATQGNLPHMHGNVEEERRLMYVGITRAKEMLFITHARYIGNEVRQRSLFVDELGRLDSRKIENKEAAVKN